MKKNDPLLMEIQDEINRENMVRFINKYGKALAIAGVILFLAVAAYQFWNQYRREQASKTGSEVYSVLRDLDKADEFATKKLEETSKTSGYYEISMLNKAHLQMRDNDFNGAVATYDAVSKNGSDKALKDLGAINAANLLLSTNPQAEGLEKRLIDISTDNSSFKYSGRELLAAYYLQNNNHPKAAEILEKLSKDPAVPVTISKRARELLSEISVEQEAPSEDVEE